MLKFAKNIVRKNLIVFKIFSLQKILEFFSCHWILRIEAISLLMLLLYYSSSKKQVCKKDSI